MIKEVTGYTWQNENGAHSAEAIAKSFYGYPTEEGNTTVQSFKATQNEGSEGNFWYFIGSLEPLGNVKTFTINMPEI